VLGFLFFNQTGSPLMPSIVKVRGEIAQLRYMDVLAGQRFDEHAHREAQYEIVLSGHFVKTVHKQRIDRRQGLGCLLAGNIAHACEYFSPVRSLSLDFFRDQDNRQLMQRRIEVVDADELGISLRNISRGLISGLIREAQQPDQLSPLAIDAYAAELLVTVLRNHKLSRATKETIWMQRVIERLNDDVQEPASIDELARLARVHPGHLAREFRFRFGVPIATFQRQLRLQAAACSLVAGVPTVDVAYAAGYAAQSQFTTAFKKAFGITPAQYRREQSR
jgi:AraC family transcriptional regulator